MGEYPVTERTRMRRLHKRAVYDRENILAILDEALTASVATVIAGRPEVQPMIHHRIGEDIILHGLAGNRMLSAIASGAETCINVMMLDALVLARRIEDHSMLYRSATIYGHGAEVTDSAEKLELMRQVFAGIVRSQRMAELPALDPNYLAGTMVVRVPIDGAVAKVNSHVATDRGPEGVWSGTLPVITIFGPPSADVRTQAEGVPLPRSLGAYSRRPGS